MQAQPADIGNAGPKGARRLRPNSCSYDMSSLRPSLGSFRQEIGFLPSVTSPRVTQSSLSVSLHAPQLLELDFKYLLNHADGESRVCGEHGQHCFVSAQQD